MNEIHFNSLQIYNFMTRYYGEDHFKIEIEEDSIIVFKRNYCNNPMNPWGFDWIKESELYWPDYCDEGLVI
jgi:hypothetical protein